MPDVCGERWEFGEGEGAEFGEGVVSESRDLISGDLTLGGLWSEGEALRGLSSILSLRDCVSWGLTLARSTLVGSLM